MQTGMAGVCKMDHREFVESQIRNSDFSEVEEKVFRAACALLCRWTIKQVHENKDVTPTARPNNVAPLKLVDGS